MIKRGKRYVLLVYAKDINLRNLYCDSYTYRDICSNPNLYWQKKEKEYKYRMKNMLESAITYKVNYKHLALVGAFHKTRDAYNFISAYNKEEFGVGGVVVTKDCTQDVTARTYYNGEQRFVYSI